MLKEFPATPFAKRIIDPEFARKLEGQDAEFTKAYNDLFDLYANKNYKEVIEKAPLLLKKYPASKLSAQIFYLQIISQGHNEKAGPFADSLQQLIKIYPYDKLIVPLAKQHLAYISANQNEMLARNVVIADVDPHDIPFTLAQENKKKATYRKIIKPYIFATKTGERIAGKKEEKPLKKPAEIVKTTPKIDSPAVKKEVAAAKVTPKKDSLKTITQVTAQKVIPKADTSKTVALVTPQVSAPAETPANIALVDTVKTSRLAISSQADPDALKAKVVVPSIFSKGDSTNYYFAVNVASGTTNLASSRFGIGQFTRANYAGNGIRHKLKAVGDHDQVIYVGLFPSLESVKKYVHDIAPLLPDIMKVPKDKYSFFIITKENLDKLADQKTLDSYVDYYQNNY
ncbi:hypothetical protein GALL_494620 [mine drainage metagenome]|uniref:Uncharacterized protein n=1 Tax=mine drainage metagenome TaxID=410659 RepID=A0A1J5PMW9_9ZZZZ